MSRERKECGWLVLHVTPWGAICWPLLQYKRGEWGWFDLVPITPENKQPWDIICVTDLATWKCCPCKPTPPVSQVVLDHKGPPGGIVARRGDDRFSIHRHACRQGFQGLTVPRLEKLRDLLAVPGPRSTTEKDLVVGIAKHLFNGITDDELKDILTKRKTSTPTDLDQSSVLFSEEGEAAAADLLDSDDVEVFLHTYVREIKAKVAKHGAPAKPASPAPAAAPRAEPPEAPPQRKPRVPLQEGREGSIDLEEARLFVPERFRLSVDRRLHFRWVIERLDKPPTGDKMQMVKTKAFGDCSVVSEFDALLVVLRWAWIEKKDVDCPWDLF